MKVLMLDIDGVLNSMENIYGKPQQRLLIDGVLSPKWTGIDYDAVHILNSIIEQSQCQVVLSSDWRIKIGVADTLATMRAAGYKYDFFGRTNSIGLRGIEILDWIKNWNENQQDPITHWAVLDDDDDDCKLVAVEDHLVFVSGTFGLMQIHVPQVLRLLGA